MHFEFIFKFDTITDVVTREDGMSLIVWWCYKKDATWFPFLENKRNILNVFYFLETVPRMFCSFQRPRVEYLISRD